jgi:hypothetical protein
MRLTPVILLVGVGLVLAGCAGQPPPPGTELPGFWWGLVHGIIAPFALIAEIFTDVRIYEFPNRGGWYDFGFMLGISTWGGEAGRRSVRRRKRKRDNGVEFEDYDFPGLKTEDGIAHIGASAVAWFKDSEGNILAISDDP